MDCLIGFIGYDSTVEVDSGLYLTSLPGVTIDLIYGISDDDELEDKTWADIEKRSILKFRTFFLNELNKCWNLTSVSVAECLICGNKDLLSVAFWYLCGAEMMSETIGSERTNRFTTVDLDKAQNLRDEFMDIFHNELHTAVAGIDLSICDETPEHGGDIQVFYAMP